MVNVPHWLKFLLKTRSVATLISYSRRRKQLVALVIGLVIGLPTFAKAQIRGSVSRGAPNIYIDASKPPYNARANGSDATPAINAALNAANAAGGGVIYLPAGTYTIEGHGLPSVGAIVLKSNTCLIGAGKGVTILKLKDDMGSDVTGLVRTPTAVATSNICLKSLTIDGNKANNASAIIIGFFSGVNPSASITGISVSETTATVTTITAHGVTAGMTVYIFSHWCPVKSRTESTGCHLAVNRSRSQMFGRPVK